MRKNYLYKPREKTHCFQVKDFSKMTLSAENLWMTDRLKHTAGWRQFGSQQKLIIKKIYNINDVIYGYCEDKFLYEIVNIGTNKKIKQFENAPYLCDIIYEGRHQLFMLSGNTGSIYDGTKFQNFVCPEGTPYCYNGDLYVFNEKDLYLMPSFRLDSKNEIAEIIRLSSPVDKGIIAGVTEYDGSILVFFSKGVYKLDFVSGETGMKFTELPFVFKNIYFGTIQKICDEVLFVENGKLYSYRKGKFQLVNSALDSLSYMTIGIESVSTGSKYFFPVSVEGYMLSVFIYDIMEKSSMVSTLPDYDLGEGGLSFDRNKMYTVVFDENIRQMLNIEWTSTWLDFDTSQEKNLYELSLYSEDDCTISIYGKNALKKLKIKKGFNKRNLSVISDKFQIQIDGTSDLFLLYDLKFNYKIKGE